jgi:glycyl-tRNA synthetase beta chain
VKALCAGRDYAAALESIATLRPPIDAFFDQVMVMDPDADIRQRRLGLLASILTSFAGIADFSEIVVTG